MQSSTLTATVRDSAGIPVTDGTGVSFETSLGSFAGGPVQLTVGGVATASLTSIISGQATVTATSGAVFTTTTVTFTPGAAWNLSLAATPEHIGADGVSTANITATITDLHGNLVADGMRWMADQLDDGEANVETAQFPSPFDYVGNALLVVPSDTPAPRTTTRPILPPAPLQAAPARRWAAVACPPSSRRRARS